jgi:PAS domain S-box-containing protein
MAIELKREFTSPEVEAMKRWWSFVSSESSLQRRLIDRVFRYLLPCVLVGLATLVRLFLNPVVGGRFPFAFFAGAVLLSAWLVGSGPALLAVALGAYVVDYLYIPPPGMAGRWDTAGWIGMGTFVTLSLGTIAVIAKYRSAMAVRVAVERRLNDGLDAANAAIWDMDLKTGEEYWSDSYYRMLGLAPSGSCASFDAWVGRIHPDDRARVLKTWEAAIDNKSEYSCQYRIVRPDGTVRWVEAKGNLTLDAAGKPVRSIGGFVDITDRKRAQVVLIEAERFAASGKMAASLAHEINNPLEAVTNLIYLMKNQPEGGTPAREYLQLAEDEIRRVARLVQKVLASHREPLYPVPANVSEIVADIVALYQLRARERDIHVEVRADDNAEILCNSEEIGQIVTNLLVNAIEAVPDGGRILVHVYRSMEWAEPCRPGVRVTIADNGAGVPPDQKSAIFQPFVTSKGQRGTGLGLWISKGIVEKNGGSLRFRSRSSHPTGTCFSVFFPGSEPREAARSRLAAHTSI